MARERWAAYSVRDHRIPFPFVSDVLLFDRVVIPVPDHGDEGRLQGHGWDPHRQAAFVATLGDRCRAVRWDADQQEQLQSSLRTAARTSASTGVDAFARTRAQLVESLPRSVTGVDTVAAYTAFDDLQRDTALASSEPHETFGLVSAAFATEFVVPASPRPGPPSLSAELDVLDAALAISSDPRHTRARRDYWRLITELSNGVTTGVEALEEALEELRDNIDERNQHVRDARIDTAARFGFLATSLTVGFLASPVTPVLGASSALLALGAFTWDQLRARRSHPRTPDDRITDLFTTIDKQLHDRYFTPTQ